jgi:hypothetical protein
MQKLEIFQSLWAMESRHPGRAERPHEDTFNMIASAGYHGVCLPLLEFAVEARCAKVSAIAQVMPVSVMGAVPQIYRWLEDAEELGINLLFETHRDSLLNDLYYTLEVLDAVPELMLTADLSHFVVEREFQLPLSRRDRGFIDRIHERADCFQGRVASREQIQVQLDFPQHQPWVELFKEFWRDGMRSWRARNPPDATCVFLCELGPRPYAMTDGQQNELSDRWQEALVMKRWIEEIWAGLDAFEPRGTRQRL